MIKVYGDASLGNCYKIKLLFSFLQIEHKWQFIDIVAKDNRTDEFRALNPDTKIPVVQFEDGRALCESNAILHYFAESTSFWPKDTYEQSLALQWLFFEQYSLEPYIARARYINKHLGLPKVRKLEFQSKQRQGHRGLKVMDKQLGENKFFVGDTPTIADVSLFANSHLAKEGGFDLSKYRNIRKWIGRIEVIPHFIKIETD